MKVFKNWNIKHFEKIDSTMDEIKKKKYNAISNLAIYCDEQKNGRGRGNNKWISKKGNLYASIKIKANFSKNTFLLPYLIGIVMYDVLQNYILEKNKIVIKWPNDILVKKKKIAGSLIEMSTQGKKIQDIVIGIGLNLKSSPYIYDYKTTYLEKESNVKTNTYKILTQFIECFECWKKHLNHGDKNIKFIIDQWMKRSFVKGTLIKIKSENKIYNGLYDGIDLDGSIKLLIKKKVMKFNNVQTITS